MTEANLKAAEATITTAPAKCTGWIDRIDTVPAITIVPYYYVSGAFDGCVYASNKCASRWVALSDGGADGDSDDGPECWLWWHLVLALRALVNALLAVAMVQLYVLY